MDERALFVRGPVVVFKWRNAEGWPVEYVSPNAGEVFGHAAQDFLSGAVAYASVVHPEDLPRVGQEVAAVAGTKQASFVHEPYRVRHADGSIRWLHDVTQVLRGPDGAPTHYLGYVVDITARVEAEEEQRWLELQLLHAQKLESLGVLAGGLAHDFNNLLTGILGEATLARMRLGEGDAEVRQGLERVEALAQRAANLTRQLLAYSGKGRFVVEPIKLSTVVKEMVSMLDSLISKKAQVCLEVDDVPAVHADRAQVQQVVMNLITNASDALGDEAGRVTVRTRHVHFGLTQTDVLPTLAAGHYVALTVEDDGCGMCPDTQTRVFDPFFTTKTQGRGLGMSAVIGILKGHQGGVRVESKVGQGSRFTVYLPVSDVAGLPAAVEPCLDEWRGRGVALVVDDEPSVRRLAAAILKSRGFEVVTAGDGAEAVERVREREVSSPVTVVVLDMMMPVKDGAETLGALRRIAPNLPVILSSGYDESQAIAGLGPGDIAGFVQKPYAPDALERAVHKALLRPVGLRS